MSPFAQRLQLFTGKGGVGKTSVVAAVALLAARAGRRPLIVELGHRASMCSVFGVLEIGYQPREVAPGVSALNVEPKAAIEAYVRESMRVPGLARLLSGNATFARFFEAAPAVNEVLTLHTIKQALKSYDPVLVDLDATGHALMFLELPAVLSEFVGRGPLRRLLEGTTAMLTDRELTRLHLVSLPAELVVQETLELCQRLRHKHGVPLGALVLNQLPAPPLSSAALDTLQRTSSERLDALGLNAAVQLARRHIARIALAGRLSDELARSSGLSIVRLPHVAPGEKLVPALVDQLEPLRGGA